MEINSKEDLRIHIVEQIKRQKEDARLTHWNDHRIIHNFDDATNFYSRVRSPQKGRKVASAFYLKSDNESKVADNYYSIYLHWADTELARIYKDNTIEFVCTPSEIWSNSQSLTSSFYTWFPFEFYRHKKGLYRVGNYKYLCEYSHKHTLDHLYGQLENLDKSYQELLDKTPLDQSPHWYSIWYTRWDTMRSIWTEQPTYFQGLKFDMLTGKCLNQRADDKFVENPEARKNWRRLLTKWKRGIKARARIGAFDSIIDKVYKEHDNSTTRHFYDWKAPDWTNGSWLDLLANSIKETKYSPELLKALVLSCNDGYYPSSEKVTSQDVFNTTNKLCNEHSIELRRKFNVFEKEGFVPSPPYKWGVDRNLTPLDLK